MTMTRQQSNEELRKQINEEIDKICKNEDLELIKYKREIDDSMNCLEKLNQNFLEKMLLQAQKEAEKKQEFINTVKYELEKRKKRPEQMKYDKRINTLAKLIKDNFLEEKTPIHEETNVDIKLEGLIISRLLIQSENEEPTIVSTGTNLENLTCEVNCKHRKLKNLIKKAILDNIYDFMEIKNFKQRLDEIKETLENTEFNSLLKELKEEYNSTNKEVLQKVYDKIFPF